MLQYKMDLVTNGVIITDAIEFVKQQLKKKEDLSKVPDRMSIRI